MRLVIKILLALVLAFLLFIALTVRSTPSKVTYGVTFSAVYAQELGLDWKQAYLATLDDLGVKKLRIPAYWPSVEPAKDSYDWTTLDYELSAARSRAASVVLVVGYRQPRWPECYTPDWAKNLPWSEQKSDVLSYVSATVGRYKNNPAVLYWQVENEPYLAVFGECGPLDEAFLKQEIALVHSLDSRPVLVTDSGNLGLWAGAYRDGDIFGTSLYIYFWNQELGQFKTKLPALVYRFKERLMEVLFGQKPTLLIELSLEPWLTEPIASTTLPTQLERMDISKFNEIIAYAKQTSFDTQYLWGVEWWYYMKTKEGHPEFWDAAKKLY
jgi:hypothetical protein